MKLIVGLGNPGREYAHNRHNVGYQFIDFIAKKYSIKINQRQCQSETGAGEITDEKALLVKPRTFVNNSGVAVAGLLQKHRIKISDLIVVYDDLDLPLGKLRIRNGGSAGGHKGIKSIISATGTQDFARIKIGIGRPDAGRDKRASEDEIVEYVLSNFASEERDIIKSTIERVSEAVEIAIESGVVEAMNRFN
jgi:peptidyl-tRNA hydrolase, PTH1 family